MRRRMYIVYVECRSTDECGAFFPRRDVRDRELPPR